MPRVLARARRRPDADSAAQGGPRRAETPTGHRARSTGCSQEEFGIDFTHYKPSTVTRRIERRLAARPLAATSRSTSGVCSASANELDVLYRDLLIGVTRFFRDEEAFEVLEEQVLPELLQREPRDAPLRLWVAGCATGEEAYSLAILLHELMQKLGERPVKIFATDVHRGSLEQATRGVYDEEAVANVSPERLARYFITHGEQLPGRARTAADDRLRASTT